MSHNSFGHLFRVTTWGESHGPALGCTVDGTPPRVPITENDIQHWLDRRKPGQNRFTTQRREADAVKILSGVFEHPETGVQVTTGTPIQLMIENTDQRSKDYGDIKDKFRPGHADYTYMEKYGVRDYRGGGRQSARETAARVAAGAIARAILPEVTIRGALVQMGRMQSIGTIGTGMWLKKTRSGALTSRPPPTGKTILTGCAKPARSCGAIIEIVASGVPVGWGAPVYGKLDTELAAAMMSINAVKGVEIGNGFDAAALSGEENADEMTRDGDNIAFASNHAGGVLGGISTGQDIVVRFAVKPTSSILTPRRTVDRSGAETEIVTKGRHDPCVGIRAVPVGEAMMACVLADHKLRHIGQTGAAPA